MENNPYLNQKYDFYEIVIVRSHKSEYKKINGLRGYIDGKLSPDDYEPGDSPHISYGVCLENVRNGWCIPEEDLESTGEFMHFDESDPRISIRVGVDEKGRGFLLDKEPRSEEEAKRRKEMGWE